MTDRTDSIRLPPDEARCEPVACTMRARCARRLASVPPNATMVDAEAWINGGSAVCTGYINAATLHKLPAQPVARRVHPPIGSES